MKIVINTQFRENYAAHNEDYVHGVSEPYWKFKGGDTYVINDVGVNDDQQKLVDEVSPMFVYSDIGSEEYIINWEILDNNDKVPCEDWETPLELTKDGDTWTKVRFYDNTNMGYMRSEILSQTQITEWTQVDDEFNEGTSSVMYTMEDGVTVFSQEGLKQWFNTKEMSKSA
jgi:hypothetical protein